MVNRKCIWAEALAFMLILQIGSFGLEFDSNIQKAEAHVAGILLSVAGLAPAIDGAIGTNEWASADRLDFVTDPNERAGTIYVMNDARNLYIALKISSSDVQQLAILFDDLHGFLDRTNIPVRSDVLVGAGVNFGDVLDGSITESSASGFTITPDRKLGGTDDGKVAHTNDGSFTYFEFSHPLCSSDLFDFCLYAGASIGFSFIYGNEIVDAWPPTLVDLTNVLKWGDIIIADFPVKFAAFTPVSPMIDGNIGADEWSRADSLDFSIRFTSTPGSIHVMNDATNLYLGLKLANRENSPLVILFDDNHNGVLEIGEDVFHGDPVFDGHSAEFGAVPLDMDAGGRTDGVVSIGTDDRFTYFEFSHPLCSSDILDFCLSAGDVVGFNILYDQSWPAHLNDVSNWGEILVAGESSKRPSSITISIKPTLNEIQDVTISGTLSPALATPVTVTYTKPDMSNSVTLVSSSSEGEFSDTFCPCTVGIWRVQASWDGDNDHLGATSDSEEFVVSEAPWQQILDTAKKRKEIYLLHKDKAFDRDWWEALADQRLEATELFGPMRNSTDAYIDFLIEGLGISLEVLGVPNVASSMTEIVVRIVDILLIVQAAKMHVISEAIRLSDRETSAFQGHLGNLITYVDAVIEHANNEDAAKLNEFLKKERDEINALRDDIAGFDDRVWRVIPVISGPLGLIPSEVEDAYSIMRGAIVTLHTHLRTFYIEITNSLGTQKLLPSNLATRYAIPRIVTEASSCQSNGYWLKGGQQVTEVNVNDSVVGRVILEPGSISAFDPRQVSGMVNLTVWMDKTFLQRDTLFDSKVIPIEIGSTSGCEVATINFVPNHAFSCLLDGYYLKAFFNGKNIFASNVNSAPVKWEIEGGGMRNEMPDSYPPRLRVNDHSICFIGRSPINMLVEDPVGRRTGFDGRTGLTLNEIPNALYGGANTEPQILAITSPLEGNYELAITGTETGSYTLIISRSGDGGAQEFQTTGTIAEGAIYTYSVDVTPDRISGQPEPAAELSQLKDFINSLAESSFIDNPDERKNKLSNKIDEIIAKIHSGKKWQINGAIKRLSTDIIPKLTETWIIDTELQQSFKIYLDEIIDHIKSLQA